MAYFRRGVPRAKRGLKAQVPEAQPGHPALFVPLLEVAAVENYPEWVARSRGGLQATPPLLKWPCPGTHPGPGPPGGFGHLVTFLKILAALPRERSGERSGGAAD